MSLLNQSQTGASVAVSKIVTVSDARARILSGLQGQLEIWMKDKGASLPQTNKEAKDKGFKHSKNGLWFKQKQMNNDWILKLKMAQTNVYLTEEAKKAANPYFTVAEADMENVMRDTMEEVRKGEWDQYIKLSDPSLIDK